MKRRQFLGVAAAAAIPLLSGCADPEAVLTMDAVSDEDIAEHASRDPSGHPEGDRIVSAAVEEGSATATGRRPPIDTDDPVVHEGRYYELTVTETGQQETTEYDISIDYDGDESPEPAIDHGDLPAVDREAVRGLLPPPEDPPGGDGYDFGVGRTYSDSEAEQSVLVPEQEYDAVVYEGTTYPIRVGDGRTVTVYDYRYEAAEVAASAAEFAERMRAEYLFTLSGLSGAERDVVTEAIDDGYYEGETSDAFESLVDRFRSHPAVESDEWGGQWLTRYEGTVYWADLRHPERSTAREQ